jgi:hypothetical protein
MWWMVGIFTCYNIEEARDEIEDEEPWMDDEQKTLATRAPTTCA